MSENELKPGWFQRQAKAVAEEVTAWPQWMKNLRRKERVIHQEMAGKTPSVADGLAALIEFNTESWQGLVRERDAEIERLRQGYRDLRELSEHRRLPIRAHEIIDRFIET